MADDYKKYEEDVKKITKKNERYLKAFENWLVDKNLSEKTIRNHVENADLYINNYLTYYDANKMEEGTSMVYSFLDDWFIRKCLWSSVASIKATAASIKKFYQCMCELGFVKKDDYDMLCHVIKENMDVFIDSYEEFYGDDEDDFWF